MVVKGRRRIGKSRLVAEFAYGKTFYKFEGLAPIEGVTDQHRVMNVPRMMQRFCLHSRRPGVTTLKRM